MRSKLIDRFTGEAVVDVPPTLIEGRYVVAAPIWLGAHTRLKQGEPLISDGAARCQLEDAEITFSIDDLAKANEARAELCTEAIRSVAERSRNKDLLSTSPLLAINLDKEARPTRLEGLLRSVVADHHLRAIEESPNIEVEYTEEVTPVGRAPAGLRHAPRRTWRLIQNYGNSGPSQGWCRAQVLARFSNDRYATYENVVFARLLDRLEEHPSRALVAPQRVACEPRSGAGFSGCGSTLLPPSLRPGLRALGRGVSRRCSRGRACLCLEGVGGSLGAANARQGTKTREPLQADSSWRPGSGQRAAHQPADP